MNRVAEKILYLLVLALPALSLGVLIGLCYRLL